MERFKQSLFIYKLTHKVDSYTRVNGELTHVGDMQVKDERGKVTRKFDAIWDRTSFAIKGIISLPFAIPVAIFHGFCEVFRSVGGFLKGG